ncbi:polyprenyl synthetase family protein [Sporosarcina thermotolerans]|uniref:Farnesyl diphosphate synthase n=1 Tax=Sporosarcina thermotolerans TaxID=633404 RepID=A0AAW9A8E6_9BACL|nr:farnesyl diphosphate synthase [Sporosarcina thermotolerans]MDW0117309.1 polyprenyl synthetase family protein [Sporosarcina thermotolerans]WHT47462.1 polyprenyl synthetase family protein [Sporosarcina thermotolerans]
MNNYLQQFISEKTPLIDAEMNQLIQSKNSPINLKDSMLYSVNAGGKRIRPLLVLAVLADFGKTTSEDALKVACAAELIHTYSLIHDDLPCMDDDDFRRGKPTNHKVYGEATAVLAGDALQTVAFGILASLQHTSPEKVVKLIALLANASGADGMVGGQILDMEGESSTLTLDELEEVHRNKTGALLSFCIEAGAILAGADEEELNQLREYATNIGLAFQIQDDILDVTSTTEQLGKTANSDTASDKSTYPSLLGLEGAKQQLEKYHQDAIECLSFIKKENSMLKHFADYIVQRNA